MSPKLRTLADPGRGDRAARPPDQVPGRDAHRAGRLHAPFAALDGFFRITTRAIPGAALGLAQNVNVYFFVALTLVALVLIGSFFRRIEPGDRLSAVSLGLIVSGALGNMLDRIFRHEVIDWAQFNLGLFIFPDFNVADSAIVIGVALLLLDVVTQETESGVAKAPGERDG